MKIKHCFQRFAAVALALTLCACYLPQALAYEPVEQDRTCTLTLSLRSDGTAVPGASFTLWKVADMSASGNYVTFTPAEAFRSALPDGPREFVNLSSGGWRAKALTLCGYAAQQSLEPAAPSAATGGDGTVTFSDLPVGLYLVSSAQTEVDGAYYGSSAFLIALPNWIDGGWQYQTAASPKLQISEEPYIQRHVHKAWDDRGYESSRPESVQVDLLKDGAVFDTVTLNAANSWSCDWYNLDNGAAWTVAEHSVSGYQSTVSLEGITFLVTNTYRAGGGDPGDPTPRPTPTPAPTPGPGPVDPGEPTPPPGPTDPGTEIPDEDVPQGLPPTSEVEIQDPETPTADLNLPDETELSESDVPLATLPQTGQLWWPVPFLALGGLVLFFAGCLRRRSAGYAE